MIEFSTEAREKLKKGVDTLANAVKVTLGAKGRNVAIQNLLGGVSLTKDGVTVAKHVIPKDPIEAMGAQIIREVSTKTDSQVADGTTTSTVLAQAIIQPGLKAVVSGANPLDIKAGMDKAVSVVVENIKLQATQIADDYDMIAKVGAISANNNIEIGEMIAGAMKEIGKYGVIKVDDSPSMLTYVDVVQGMKFDRGFVSPHFIRNHESLSTEFTDPLVLIYDSKLTTFETIYKIMDKVALANRPILIIADDIEAEALTNLAVNNLKGVLSVVVVKTPAYGDEKLGYLKDLAALLETKVFSADNLDELDTAELDDLGSCERVIVDRFSTTIIGGVGNIEDRIKTLEYELSVCTNDYDKDKLQERLARLSGGVAIVYVGGNSEVEMKEKKDRVVDAVGATRAAVEEGIVLGGGVAYLRALSSLEGLKTDNEDQNIGIDIIRKALQAPLNQIAINCGKSGEVVVNKVMESAYKMGYNAKTDTLEDLMEAGIIDPAKVTRVALENASSVAGMLLTTECVITYENLG